MVKPTLPMRNIPGIGRSDAIGTVQAIPETILAPSSSFHPGEWMYERIARSIIEFEAKLDPDKEVGARLVNFGGGEIIHVEDVGYWGVDLIKFHGKNDNGHPVELLQHISQVNVLLVAVPTQSDPPRRIGFILEADLDKRSKGEE